MIELPCLMVKREDPVDLGIDYESLGLPEPESTVEESVLNVCFGDIDWFFRYDDDLNNTKVSYKGYEFICTLSYEELKEKLYNK